MGVVFGGNVLPAAVARQQLNHAASALSNERLSVEPRSDGGDSAARQALDGAKAAISCAGEAAAATCESLKDSRAANMGAQGASYLQSGAVKVKDGAVAVKDWAVKDIKQTTESVAKACSSVGSSVGSLADGLRKRQKDKELAKVKNEFGAQVQDATDKKKEKKRAGSFESELDRALG